ncbi:MAG: radical SAM protein [Bacteroidetes bacterium]|nr:radical SAM protein [Bacteroidota bacterium]
MAVITDKYGRSFSTLRVSLLHHCNLGCVYCVSGNDELKQANASGKTDTMAADRLLAMIDRLHRQLQLSTIRLTGGEPLLYPGLVDLIRGIKAIGISSIKLTTNGFLLERLALPLKEAGMQSINVSLDALDEDVFFAMSRRHSVDRIIRGIDAALAAGLNVKLNTVAMKGINDSQLLPLAAFAAERGLKIRYLEVMAMGHLYAQADRHLLTRDEILDILSRRYVLTPLDREASATARYWQAQGGPVIGIIANESEPFCRDCDRLRLDSSGNIYGCLSSNHPIALGLEETEEEWGQRLQQAMAQKQLVRFTGSDLSMLQIGG